MSRTLLAVLIGLSATASAEARSLAVTSHFDDPGFLVITPETCDPGQPGFCTAGGDGGATFTRDLIGSSEYHATFWLDPFPSGAKGRVRETFYGAVAGCGTGSVHWELLAAIDFSQYDPMSNTFPMDGTWQIAPGSGTGGLADAGGGGTFAATVNLLTRENHGTLTGTVTCHPDED